MQVFDKNDVINALLNHSFKSTIEVIIGSMEFRCQDWPQSFINPMNKFPNPNKFSASERKFVGENRMQLLIESIQNDLEMFAQANNWTNVHKITKYGIFIYKLDDTGNWLSLAKIAD